MMSGQSARHTHSLWGNILRSLLDASGHSINLVHMPMAVRNGRTIHLTRSDANAPDKMNRLKLRIRLRILAILLQIVGEDMSW